MSISIMDELESAIVEDVQKVTAKLVTQLSLMTPVDTGNAVANWIISVNSVDTSTETSVAGEAARAIPQKGLVKLNAIKASDTVIVQNNQPYINRLNEGWWSQKAPANFVEQAIEVAKRVD